MNTEIQPATASDLPDMTDCVIEFTQFVAVDNPAFAAHVAKHAKLLQQNPAFKGKTNKPGPS